MNLIEFSKSINSEDLAIIFKYHFEQHMAAYNILNCIEFVKINNITFDRSSIMYSIKLLDNENKDKLLQNLSNLSVEIYGKIYTPSIFINGDLLCITIDK